MKVLRCKPAHTGAPPMWPGPKGRAGRYISDTSGVIPDLPESPLEREAGHPPFVIAPQT